MAKGLGSVGRIAAPRMPRIVAAPRLLHLTPENMLRGAVTAAVVPTPKSVTGRRMGRRARRKARKAVRKG